MSCTEQITNQIRRGGFRPTPQCLAILQVLQHSGAHLTPVEVHARVEQALPGLKESTVYRALEFLEKNGFALAMHTAGGKLVYQVAGHDHHHVICTHCGKEMEIEHTQLVSLYSLIEQITGYRLTTCHLAFSGLCPDCQKTN
jgi:Fur family ferric uptake transcriptional regulator